MEYIALESLVFMKKNPYHCPENYFVCSNYVILMNIITYNYFLALFFVWHVL